MTDKSLSQDTRYCRDTYIYALVDSRDNSTFYVGKTIREPIRRLKQHISHAKTGNEPNKAKQNRINKLVALGLDPKLKILEVVPAGGNWADRERFWIAFGYKQGWPLLNISSGGDEPTQACYEAAWEAKSIDIPDYIIKQFGKRSDSELARLIGCDPKTIGYQRRKRNIPRWQKLGDKPNSYDIASWPQWALDLMGYMRDVDIAKYFDLDKQIVRAMRIKLGRPHHRFLFPQRDIDAIRFLAGRYTDKEIAKQFKTNKETVKDIRERYGIQSFDPRRVKQREKLKVNQLDLDLGNAS